MLKTTIIASQRDENQNQGGKKIEVNNQDEKKRAQKSDKGQQTTTSKKRIHTQKAEASKRKNLRAKDLDILSELFLIFGAKASFTKLRQVFIKVLILNHFDLERYIQIQTDASGYMIGATLRRLVVNNLNK